MKMFFSDGANKIDDLFLISKLVSHQFFPKCCTLTMKVQEEPEVMIKLELVRGVFESGISIYIMDLFQAHA